MGEMVDMATWRRRGRQRDRMVGAAHAPAGRESSEEAQAGTAGAPRAIVRSVVLSAEADRDPEREQITRLERAVRRIDRVTARITSRDGGVAPEIETELLALVGQVTLGMVGQAADRAERLVSSLGAAAASPS